MYQPVYHVSLDQLQNLLNGNGLSSLVSGDGEVDTVAGNGPGTIQVKAVANQPTSFYIVPSTSHSEDDPGSTNLCASDSDYIAQVVDTTAEDLGEIVDSEAIADSSNGAIFPPNYMEVKDDSQMREVVENIFSHIKPGLDIVVKEENVDEFNVDSVFNKVKAADNSNDLSEKPDVSIASDLKPDVTTITDPSDGNVESSDLEVLNENVDGNAECSDPEVLDENIGSPITEADADFEDDVSDISEAEFENLKKTDSYRILKDDGTFKYTDESDNDTDIDDDNTKGCQAALEDLGKVGKVTKKKARKRQKKVNQVKKNSKQEVICEVCGEVKPSYHSYYQHKRNTHDDNVFMYKCKECDYETKFPASFQRHKEKHEYYNGQREKSFKCDKCDKTFLYKCNLKQHMVLHSEVMPFHCQFCDKGFAQKHNYTVHMSKHLPDGRYAKGAKTYEYRFDSEGRCIVDDPNAGKFKRELKFRCEICGRLFRWNQDMKRHVKTVHEGVKAFVCSLCRKTFVDKAALRIHMNSNHGSVRQFKCQLCPKEYFSNSKLKEHIALKHDKTQNRKVTPSAAPSKVVPPKVVIISQISEGDIKTQILNENSGDVV